VTIYDLKPAFQNLLRPMCRALANAGVSANQVTVAALLLSLVVGALFALNPEAHWAALMIPIWLFLRMALNAIDGMLAREHDMQSELGGFLNELSDVIADAALYLPFALIPGVSASLVIAIVILSILTEMAGVVSVQVGASRRYDGPMGKSDRAFVFGLFGLLYGLGVEPGWWINGLLGVVAVLTALTILNRVRRGLDELTDSASPKRTYILAAAWGVAEATFFFIVPDVLLSWIALRSYRRAMICCVWATVGALLGGLVIWALGTMNPDLVRAIFAWIPAINEQMISNVQGQLGSQGLIALFIGPLIGTPYKIYGLEC